MRNQKGITLIALVITIIVLLILAGVAIAMLSGDNGILNKANESAEDTSISAAKEAVMLEVNTAWSEFYDKVHVKNEETTIVKEVNERLEALTKSYGTKNGSKIEYTPVASAEEPTTDGKVTITYTGKTTVTVTGTVKHETGEFSWDTTD